MTSSTQAPADLEYKAPAALAPRPEVSTPPAEGAVPVDPAKATVTMVTAVTMVAAVTATCDEVGDVIIPGAFTRTLRQHTSPMYRLAGSPHGALHRGFRRFVDELRRTARQVV